MIKKIKLFFSTRTLFSKIMISILMCIAIFFVLFSMVLSNYLKPIIEERMILKANETITKATFDIYKDIIVAEQAIHTTAKILSEQENIDIEYLLNYSQATLRSLYDKYKIFHSLWIYIIPENDNEKGYLYQCDVIENEIVHDKFLESDEISKQQWKTEVLNTGGICWAEPFHYINRRGDDFFATSVSVPFQLKGSSKLNGIISISVDLRQIQERVSKMNFYENGKLLLLSRKGKYIVHPDPNIQMNETIFDLANEYNLPQLKLAGEELAKGKSGFISMPKSSVFNSKVVFVYSPIYKVNWGACLVFPSNMFFQSAKQIQIVIISLLILCLVILGIIIHIICRHITNPLKELTIIVDKYGQGIFSNEIPKLPISNDEVGILSKSFINTKKNLLNLIRQQQEKVIEIQKRKSELDIAKKLKESSLSRKLPKSINFCLANGLFLAKETNGNFYDFFFKDQNHFVFLVADSSGEGISSTLFMMKTKESIRRNIEKYSTLSEAITRINNELCSDNELNLYATIFVAILDIKIGIVEYVNIGHSLPLLNFKDGKYDYIVSCEKNALGTMNDISYEINKLQLQYGSTILLYTNGLVKLKDFENKLYYSCNNLKDCLNKGILSPEDTIKNIKTDIDNFSNNAELSEDVAILCLTYLGNKENFVTQATIEQWDKISSFLKNDMINKNISKEKQDSLLSISKDIFENIICYAYKNIGNIWIKIGKTSDKYTIVFSDFGQPNSKEAILSEIGNINCEIDYIRENAQNKIFITIKL